jgi:TonB family protein
MSAHTQVTSAFEPARDDVRRLNRAINWSVAVHVALVVGLLVVPRSWWTRPQPKRNVMTISLGGSPGPRTGGSTSLGGRTIEEVAPPPKRPEPVRPTPERPPSPVAVTKPAPRPAPKPAETVKPAPETPPATRPPVTGSQVVEGNTAVETGARGQGPGLSSGGRFGGETDWSTFCCPEYLDQMLNAIDSNWRKDQPERGTTTLKFTVTRDGHIENVLLETSSGYGALDRAARAALLETRLGPLPGEYPNQTLTVHLRFPYGAP